MALKDAVQLAEVIKLLAAEEAALAQRAVQAGRRVALGEDEAVAVRVLVILGIDALHHVKVKRDKSFGGGQGAAGMARSRLVGHDDDVPPHLPRDGLQFLNSHTNILLAK